MQKSMLSPKNDFVFKLIFGDVDNIDILTGFLQSVLDIPPEEYEKVTIIDPHLRKTDADDKLGILDLLVETTNGRKIDVDIQVDNAAGMKERIVYYTSKMITAQMKESYDYDRIKQVITIVITDFILVKDSDKYHNGYVLHDPQSGSVFSDVIKIHILELPKARKGGGDGTALMEWLRFFNAETEEEYMAVAERNPRIGGAVAVLKRLSADEETRLLAEAREKQRRDERARLIFARQEEQAKWQTVVAEKDAELQSKDAELQSKDAELQSKDAEIVRLKTLLRGGQASKS